MDTTNVDLPVSDAAAVARRMWIRLETYHGVVYGTAESRAVTDALGCKGGWMGYFGMRAAPLGAASAATITSAFYNFHPSLVSRAVPDVWRVAGPEAFLTARLAAADTALAALAGRDVLTGPEIAEAATLAVQAAAAAPTAGRPLAAANVQLPTPDDPHLALWQAATTLRESRGDGHVAALVAADLDPCEALVAFAADRGIDRKFLQAARWWSDDEWLAATDRLTDRGLMAEGRLTERGAAVRAWVEQRTDQAAVAPWQAIGPAATDRLAELLRPVALRIAQANEAMKVNPMGLDAAAELSG
jgi:hypothetical protein